MFDSDLQAPAIRRGEERMHRGYHGLHNHNRTLSLVLPEHALLTRRWKGRAGNNEVLCKDARDDVTGTKICHERSQSSLQKKG